MEEVPGWEVAACQRDWMKNSNNFIYFTTADGQFDNPLATHGNAGDSFLKLTTELQVSDYFTPSDEFYRWDTSCGTKDKDLGSGGVLLIPDGVPTSGAHLAVNGDKEGAIWVVDRTLPGEYGGPAQPTCTQYMTDHMVQSLRPTANGYHALFHNTPAYWNGALYFAGSGTDAGKANILPLTQFPLCPSTKSPICGTSTASTVRFTYGATPSVSSSGTTNGIVWAVDSDGSATGGAAAVMHAFNASSMAELYNSGQCGTADVPGSATKFSVPTIANGYVFIGTQTDFDIYGPLQTRQCQ
jgi:hypothetical protein